MVESIAVRVDPVIAALPPLPRPRIAAWTLLFFVLSITVAVLSKTLAWAALHANEIPAGSARSAMMTLVPASLVERLVAVAPTAVAVSISAVLGLIVATGTRGLPRIGLVLGPLAWLAASFLPPSSRSLVAGGIAAAITLLAFAPVIADLSRRSRSLRSHPATRQPIGPVESAILLGIAAFTFSDTLEPVIGPDATTALRLVSVACVGMTVVGFLYLAWNAIAIWLALSRWQPILERVIDRGPVAAPPAARPAADVRTE